MAPPHQDDWSDSDDEALSDVETSVLLGVPDGLVEAATDVIDAAVSRIGGHPVRSISHMYYHTEYLDLYPRLFFLRVNLLSLRLNAKCARIRQSFWSRCGARLRTAPWTGLSTYSVAREHHVRASKAGELLVLHVHIRVSCRIHPPVYEPGEACDITKNMPLSSKRSLQKSAPLPRPERMR